MKRTSFLFLCIISFQELMADSLVSGVVLNLKTKEPIPNVNIYIDQRSIGTITNKDGEFSLKISKTDSVIVFEHIGYQKAFKDINNDPTNNLIYLEPNVIALSELNIIGKKEYGLFSELETNNMVSEIGVKSIFFRTYSDLGDILMNEESVLMDESTRGVKKVSIRGARQEEIEFMYDGIPIHHEGRNSLDISIFDIGGMKAVEVLRGGSKIVPGSSGTINFVPNLNYGNSANLFQRFGTYNTGSFNGGLSIGNHQFSLNLGRGKSKSQQYYDDAENEDIQRLFNNEYINFGVKPINDVEIKFYYADNIKLYKNYFLMDSTSYNYKTRTFKLEKNSEQYGYVELYFSSQIFSGKDNLSLLRSTKENKSFLSGLAYSYKSQNTFFKLNAMHSTVDASWDLISGNIDINRNILTYSSMFGVSKDKSSRGIQIKDFILSLNSNITIDKNINESSLVNDNEWENRGVNFLFSAWEHVDDVILYVYSNIGNSLRVPSLNERYFHALRPSELEQDTLLEEGKMMQEVGLKIMSKKQSSNPYFQGSMSYFNYSYNNKIKSIQYSASALNFPVNDGTATISGVELNAEMLGVGDFLGFRSIYSAYTYSNQLSFPMQPMNILRNSVLVSLGSLNIKATLKKEGPRILTTIGREGVLENNYLNGFQSFDIQCSYTLSYKDFDFSIALFGQNIGDDSQMLDGISIFDKRVYISLGLLWE